MNDFEIIQNESIGAVALWSFSLEYYKTSHYKHGPKLPYLFSILPLLYNNHTLINIYQKNFSTGFFSSISQNPTIFIGLNERINSLKITTLNSILLGTSSGLINFDSESLEILPIRKTNPFPNGNFETDKIIKGAKRLGHWYSDLGIDQIYSILRIKL